MNDFHPSLHEKSSKSSSGFFGRFFPCDNRRVPAGYLPSIMQNIHLACTSYLGSFKTNYLFINFKEQNFVKENKKIF
jgi:hypothetical protein